MELRTNRTFAATAVVAAVLLSGCQTAVRPGVQTGSLYEQSHAVVNFKTSGRAKFSRVAVVYPGDNEFQLRSDLVTKLMGRFADENLPATIATTGNELAMHNAQHRIRHWGASHVLRVDIPNRDYLDGALTRFKVELLAYDLRDGMKVWTYSAHVVIGSKVNIDAVIQSAFAAMVTDGLR